LIASMRFFSASASSASAGNQVDLLAEDPPGGQPLDILPIESDKTSVGELRRGA
jgi:hypothetical protein